MLADGLTPQQIQDIITQAAREGYSFRWWQSILCIVASTVSALAFVYFSERFRNRAKLHDTPKITDAEETAKDGHAARKETLRERLAAHQMAFQLWQDLLHKANSGREIMAEAHKCEVWFIQNKFYLSPEVQTAFNVAIHAASYRGMIMHDGQRTREEGEELAANWKEIEQAEAVIEEAINAMQIHDKPAVAHPITFHGKEVK
jgi:hypothetical protein